MALSTATNDPTSSKATKDNDHGSTFTPPFLVRSKTREEKDLLRQQFQKQEAAKNDQRSPYESLYRIYSRFSTSFMLENKAAVARDHLANERTFLAWLRTSLSLITVGVG
ncbi:hypothetical protein BD560DRAFT_408551, partial [Blakeslea trispora]